MSRISGNIVVSVDEKASWAVSAIDGISEAISRPTAVSLKVMNVSSVRNGYLRELEPGVWIGKDCLVDAKYGVRIERDEDGALILLSDRPALEWLMWLLNLAALRSRSAFVHGAAVERNGQAILFPSWGGVGKTALVSGFIKEHGWRLLGDDLVIVEEDGSCHPFPKPMVLYPYHRTVFPEVFDSGRGPVAPTFMNRWLTSAAIAVKPGLRQVPGLLAFARKHNPQSARVSPVDVFGPAAISEGGTVRATIWLERLAGIDKPQLLQAGDPLVSRIIGSTTNEYDPRCVRLTNILMGLGMVHLDEYWSEWRQIVEGAIADRPQYILNLPVSMPVADVPSAVRDALMSLNLWSEAS